MSFLGVRNGISVAVQAAVSFATGKLYPSMSLNFAGMSELPSTVTFSRGTAATMYGSDGLLTQAPQNLLTYSEQFDNVAWVKNVVGDSVTANVVVAPDGTTTADKFTPSAVSGSHYLYQVATFPGQHNASVYAKAAGYNWIIIQTSAGYAWFNITAGTAGAVGNAVGVTASITASVNDWFRCSITGASTASGQTAIWAVNGNAVTTMTGDGTSGVYVWGSQLAAVTWQTTPGTYNPTTSAAYYGPRFDYDPASYVYQNLLTYSEQFDNAAWTKSSATVTANAAVSPDGTLTADTFTPTATAALLYQGITKAAIATTFTASFYAKANGLTSLRAYVYGNTNANRGDATFDLSAGTVGAITSVGTFTATSAAITSVGSGWYRCVITTTSDNTTQVSLALRFDGTANSVSGFYIWGAQLNAGSTALPYYATTSAAYTQCTPRGLLIEEARTNLTIYSQDLTNAAWVAINGTTGTSTINGPDGVTKLGLWTAAAAGNRAQQVPTILAATTYTMSVYLANSSTGYGGLSAGGAATAGAIFNLTGSGAVVSTAGASVTAAISPVGNGIYRCSLTFPSTAAGSCNAGFGVSDGSTYATGIYPSSTSGTIQGSFAQFEPGSFATSYIPTVAATVTRNADNASMTGTNFSSWFNATQGTTVVQADTFRPSDLVVSNAVSFGDGTSANVHRVFSYFGNIGGGTNTSGTTVADLQPITYTLNSPFKFAYAYATNDFAAVGNGGTPATDALGALPTGLTTLGIGNWQSVFWCGHIRSLAYYPVRLPNTTLQALTT